MCNEYLYWAFIIVVILFLLKQTQLGSRFTNRILYTGSSMNTVDDRAGHEYDGTISQFAGQRILNQGSSMDLEDDRPGHEYSGSIASYGLP